MYQALYRKYRPAYFSEVSGQQAVIKTLSNSIITNKINHAYLFSGPRGTGKTSVAKIFARTVNCLTPINGESCGNCVMCQEASEKDCVDIIEIDAASNNGVDEIRELRNKINLVPNALKYKVYIIDEVHMLSIGAFNALLKTLEEPPEHVIFILATTDPHKVPITILSRCQCFAFKKISQTDLVNKINEVVGKEKIKIQPEVVREIAYYSDGGLRDALGMLDKLSSYSLEEITMDDFQITNGLLSYQDLLSFINLIISKDVKAVLKRLKEFDENGRDFIQIAEQLIKILRNDLVCFYVDNKELLCDKNFYYHLIQKINKCLFEMKNSEHASILLEMTLLSSMDTLENRQIISREIICDDKNVTTEQKKEDMFENFANTSETIVSPMENKEASKSESEGFKSQSGANPNVSYSINQKLLNLRVHNTLALAEKEELNELKQQWATLSDFVFDPNIGYLICILLDGTIRAASQKTVLVSYPYESMVEKGYDNLEQLEHVFEEKLHKKRQLLFIGDERWVSEKAKFIESKTKKESYKYEEEPEGEELLIPIHQENEKTEESGNTTSYETACHLFGDIVEIEK